MKSMRKKKLLFSVLVNIFKILVLIVFMSPFYVAINYAVKTKQEIAQTGLGWPEVFHFENFTEAIRQTYVAGMPFFKVLLNTTTATVAGTIVIVVISAMAAYALARRTGRIYSLCYTLMVITLLVPIQAYMFPLYDELRGMGLLNTNLGFILAKIGTQVGYSVIITTGFVKGISIEIEEAALIDGANLLQVFMKIVVPLLKPILMTSVVINALSIWNDFGLAFIVLTKPSNYVLPLLQFTFITSNTSMLNLAFALFLLTMLPILILYFFLQKYIVGGIMLGSVKG